MTKFDWMLKDDKGNTIIKRGNYTWNEQNYFIHLLQKQGMHIKENIASVPNVTIMK